LLDTDQKIIFLDYQNNFVGILKVTSNAAKNVDILATVWVFYIIILIVEQNYFSDLCSSKILDFSAKPFFLKFTKLDSKSSSANSCSICILHIKFIYTDAIYVVSKFWQL